MSALKIDADALFRAVGAHDYKLLAYYLDLRSGEVTSKTLAPGEVQDVPHGPVVKPIPAFGHDIGVKKGDAPFGPPPVEKKTDLFKDDGPKKNSFEGDFWKREGRKKTDLFGDGGHRKESSSKKLAELFGEKPAEVKPAPASSAHPEPKAGEAYQAQFDPEDPLVRIPPASEAQHLIWMRAFAKDCGDPQIREKLERAIGAEKPIAAFERVLRNFQRSEQQWENYYYRQALHYAEAWLKALPIQWEIVEDPGRHRPA